MSDLTKLPNIDVYTVTFDEKPRFIQTRRAQIRSKFERFLTVSSIYNIDETKTVRVGSVSIYLTNYFAPTACVK